MKASTEFGRKVLREEPNFILVNFTKYKIVEQGLEMFRLYFLQYKNNFGIGLKLFKTESFQPTHPDPRQKNQQKIENAIVNLIYGCMSKKKVKQLKNFGNPLKMML